MFKNFWSTLVGSSTFDILPYAWVNHKGIITSSNSLFKQHVSYRLGNRMQDLFNIRTVDNKIIGSRDGSEWALIYKSFGRSYKVWAVPEPQEAPSVWSVLDMAMIWISKAGEVKFINPVASREFPGLKVGDFVSKHCSSIIADLLFDGTSHDILWSDQLCKVRIFEKDDDLWLLLFESLTDVTKVDDELKESNHLKSLGQITSSVVHDFRNILAVINGYCDLILDSDEPGTAKEYMNQIRDTVHNATVMVKELLRFARSNIGKDVSSCPAEVVSNLKNVLQKIVGRGINIALDIKDSIARVALSVTDLERIIVNIVVNAKDAMGHSGTLTIRVGKKYFSDSWRVNDCYIRPGFYLVLTIDDQGCGIPLENQEKVLVPFFTTKKSGNGLGLSSILSMVRDISGGLQILSAIGSGTRVNVYLPVVQILSHKVPTAALNKLIDKKKVTGNILLVEDNEDVLRICKLVLEKDGYFVMNCDNAERALQIASDTSIDLLITDANLPGMSGAELVIELKKRLELKNILVISGYEPEILKPKFPPHTKFLAKPIPLSELRNTVYNMLGDGK